MSVDKTEPTWEDTKPFDFPTTNNQLNGTSTTQTTGGIYNSAAYGQNQNIPDFTRSTSTTGALSSYFYPQFANTVAGSNYTANSVAPNMFYQQPSSSPESMSF